MTETEKIKSRFQFLATVALFFPLILEALLQKANPETISSGVNLLWGAVICMLIAIYILLECVKTWVSPLIYKSINILIFINLAVYAAILLLLARLEAVNLLPGFLLHVFALLMNSVFYIPVLILILLSINLVISIDKKLMAKKY